MEVIENYSGVKAEMCFFALGEFGIITLKVKRFRIIFSWGMVNIPKLCMWLLVGIISAL